MPDTGASQSIVPVDVARAANLSIRPTVTELRNASNGVMSLVGEADAVMCNDKHSTESVVLVSPDLSHSALISWQDLQSLCVIPASFPAVAAHEKNSERQCCDILRFHSTTNPSPLPRARRIRDR